MNIKIFYSADIDYSKYPSKIDHILNSKQTAKEIEASSSVPYQNLRLWKDREDWRVGLFDKLGTIKIMEDEAQERIGRLIPEETKELIDKCILIEEDFMRVIEAIFSKKRFEDIVAMNYLKLDNSSTEELKSIIETCSQLETFDRYVLLNKLYKGEK